MKNIVLIMALACLALTAQGQVVTLNLDKCREMALENSRKMSIAAKQQEKAGYDLKSYRANFLPKISGMGMFAYVQKKMSYSLAGGYLPTFVPGLDGSLQPNVVLNPATGQPLTDADGNPVFSSYAYMPDIELDLDLRGAYSVGVMLEQPVYMGGKVRSAYQMAALGKEMAEMNVRYSRAEVLTETDEAYWQYLRVVELVASAEKYGLAVPSKSHLGGASDASRIDAPVLCSCGVPGSGNHTSSEYADVEGFFERAKLLCAAILEADSFAEA